MNTEPVEPIQPEENNQQQTPQKLEITDEITEQLQGAAKWAKFLAILGFVFIGFLVLVGFMLSIFMTLLPASPFLQLPFPGFLFGLIYLLLALVYFFPILYLFRFSTNTKQAISAREPQKMLKAFENLRSHYRYIGIVMIVMLGLYLLTLAFMLFAGLLAGFSEYPGFTGMHA